MSHGSPSGSEISRTDIKWLGLIETNPPGHFDLDGFLLPYAHATELFQHFEDNYQPHFCIMEPVSSLQQLYNESQFLFWSIILVASRNHYRHAPSYERLRPLVTRMHMQIAAEAIQSLYDLQALLLLCTFPCHMPGQLRDPGWPQIGTAINAARQIGLDKDRDEVVLGAHPGLNRHPRYIRQMTWMKCFELDVQMSCWHGHLPSLGYPHHARTIARFCDTLPVAAGYAAVVSIHAELAQSLLALEDGMSAGNQAPSFLVRMFNERLNAVKTKWSAAWSLDAEIELMTARLYLYGACLLVPEETSFQSRNDGFHAEMLQASQSAAVQLSTILTNVHDELMANLQSLGYSSRWWPLPGRPRHVARSAFFAATVLLKYLDDPHGTTDGDSEAAKNAFGKVYQMLSNAPDSAPTDYEEDPRSLEAAGRAIISNDKGRLHSHVTSRMGASIRYNVIWLANSLNPHEESNPPSNVLEELSNHFVLESHHPAYTDYENIFNPTTTAPANVVLNESLWDTTAAVCSMPGVDMGFGAWDDSAFDSWQNSLPYPAAAGMQFDSLTAMTRA